MIDFKFIRKENEDERSLKGTIFHDENRYTPKNEKIPWHLIIYFRNIPIGVASFLEIDPETFEIYDIGVKEEFRHHKVGSYILKFIGTKVKDLGGRYLEIYSPIELKTFFMKNSFKDIDNGEVVFLHGSPYLKLSSFLYQNSKYKRKRY